LNTLFIGIKPKFLQPVPERAETDAQKFAGPVLVAAAALKALFEIGLLIFS